MHEFISPYKIESDRPREECGVYALYLDPSLSSYDIVSTTLTGALQNQHRGEESAGFCISDGTSISPAITGMGQIKTLYEHYKNNERVYGRQYGFIGLSHNRYSTTGSSTIENAGPFRFDIERAESFAVAHNGNITNSDILKAVLANQGTIFRSTTDTEVIGHLIANSPGKDIFEKMMCALPQLEGSFSLIVSTKDSVYAARDRHGIRPLSMASFRNGGKRCFVVSSETCGFYNVPVDEVREIQPGELTVIKDGKWFPRYFSTPLEQALCGLEIAYLLRPDSYIGQTQVESIRRRHGELLAEFHPVPDTVDIVTYVPESSRPASDGYARKLSQVLGRNIDSQSTMIKGKYGSLNGGTRGFMNPDDANRKAVGRNYFPFEEIIGKEIVVVDDSIIRGTTTKGVVESLKKGVGLLKNCGAAKVHLRIVFPPVVGPCNLGTDINETDFLVAREKNMDMNEITSYLGADSLAYLTVEQYTQGVNDVVNKNKGLCMGCVTGKYPID